MPSRILEKFSDYLTHQRGLSPNTVTTYYHHARSYFRFLTDKGTVIADIGKDSVSSFIESLRRQNKRSATLFVTHMALRAFHEFLVAEKILGNNPTLNLPLPKIQSRMPEPMAPEEVNRLLVVSSAHVLLDLRDRAIMELLYCGLRLNEALSLNRQQVHMTEGYVKVFGKGSRERLVPIGRQAVASLARYLPKLDQTTEPGEPLFISQKGNRLAKCSFWRRFKKLANHAGLGPSVHPHLLRHSFAVTMLKGRTDIRSLQLLLGHSSLSSTQKYLNIDWASLQDTCRKAHPRF